MKGITITQIQPVASDSRGETFELFKNFPGLQVSLYTRNEGSLFGCHFHKGEDPSKDPELFFLISGSLEFFAYNGVTKEVMREIISDRTTIVIDKAIYHECKALTDVAFLEYRSTVFDKDKSDSFPKEEYEVYTKQLTRHE